MQNFSCLSICKTADRRIRLREALRTHFDRPRFESVNSYEQAKKRLADDYFKCLFVFLYGEPKELLDFLESLKAEEFKRPPITLVSLGGEYLESSLVAELYLQGIQGFLCEPFSANDVRELMLAVTDLSTTSQNPEIKVSRTSGFLISNAMQVLDEAARAQAQSPEKGGYALKELRRVAESLQELAPKLEDGKLEQMLVGKFVRAQTSKECGRGPTKKPSSKREVAHPGAEVAERLERLGVSKERLLAVVEIESEKLDQFLAGELPITEDLAESLSRALGQTVEFWLNMQKRYEKTQK